MLTAVMVLAVATVPAPTEVGSVEGSFGWFDLHAGLASFKLDVGDLPTMGTGPLLLIAAQLQAFAGYGLTMPGLGHHLAISGSLYGTLVPAPFNYRGNTEETLFQPSALRLGVSLPLGQGVVTLVPKLGLGVPMAPGRYVTLTPALAVRERLAEVLLLGADAGFTFHLLQPNVAGDAPIQYDWDADTVAPVIFGRFAESWRAQARLQAEYEVLPALSVTAQVEAGVRDLQRLYVGTTSDWNRSSFFGVARERTIEIRSALEANWAFTERFGLTASVAALQRLHTDKLLSRALSGYTETLWEGHLSLWFRTDARLRRSWLER